MAEKVEYLKKKSIIKIDSFGVISLKDLQVSLEKVLEISLQKNCKKVLVDVRNQEAMPELFDCFEFAKSLPGNICFAVVVASSESKYHDFVVTTGVFRGKCMRLFDCYDEALEWLE